MRLDHAVTVLTRALLTGALLISLLATGCSHAIFSVVTFRREAPLAADAQAQIDVALRGTPLSKGEVLSTFGPPLAVIGLANGDIFVYRRQAADTSTINLNPAFFASGSPPISIYYDRDESYRDDVLMVFFDRQGQVCGHALSAGSREGGSSRAARIGESVQEILK